MINDPGDQDTETSDDTEADAMEQAQEDAAREREENGGYQ